MSDLGNIKDALYDARLHMKEDHGDNDWGNRVKERHDERYPDCDNLPRLKDYKFGSTPRRERFDGIQIHLSGPLDLDTTP